MATATFRDDMARVIERLNSYAYSGLSPHPYIQCQILLVQFMTDVIAETQDTEILENLDAWEEKCEDALDSLEYRKCRGY